MPVEKNKNTPQSWRDKLTKVFQSATLAVAGLMAAGGIILDVLDAFNVPEVKEVIDNLYGPRALLIWAFLVVVARLRTLWRGEISINNE